MKFFINVLLFLLASVITLKKKRKTVASFTKEKAKYLSALKTAAMKNFRSGKFEVSTEVSKMFYKMLKESDSCTVSASSLPNASYLSKGYDLQTGNPLVYDSSSSSMDPGFKESIFAVEFDEIGSNPTVDSLYDAPIGWEVTKSTTGCTSTKTSTSSINTPTDLSSSMNTGLWGGGYENQYDATNEDKKNAFSANAQFTSMNTKMESNNRVYFSSSAKCIVYTAKVKTTANDGPNLHTNFISEITKLSGKDYSKTSDQDTFYNFLQKYGTHYLKNVDMGSKTTYVLEMTSTSKTEISKSGADVSVEVDAWVVSVTTEVKTSSSSNNTIDSVKTDIFKMSNGAPLPTSGNDTDVASWMAASAVTPVPVNYQLEKLETLLAYDFVRTQLTNTTLTKTTTALDVDNIIWNLGRATRNYCEKLKAAGKATDCGSSTSNTVVEKYTDWYSIGSTDKTKYITLRDWSNFVLDCTDGYGMNSFELQYTSKSFRYKYQCISSTILTSTCTDNSQLADSNLIKVLANNYPADFLNSLLTDTDAHKNYNFPTCASDYVLSKWSLTNSNITSVVNNVNTAYTVLQFAYRCCKTSKTGLSVQLGYVTNTDTSNYSTNSKHLLAFKDLFQINLGGESKVLQGFNFKSVSNKLDYWYVDLAVSEAPSSNEVEGKWIMLENSETMLCLQYSAKDSQLTQTTCSQSDITQAFMVRKKSDGNYYLRSYNPWMIAPTTSGTGFSVDVKALLSTNDDTSTWRISKQANADGYEFRSKTTDYCLDIGIKTGIVKCVSSEKYQQWQFVDSSVSLPKFSASKNYVLQNSGAATCMKASTENTAVSYSSCSTTDTSFSFRFSECSTGGVYIIHSSGLYLRYDNNSVKGYRKVGNEESTASTVQSICWFFTKVTTTTFTISDVYSSTCLKDSSNACINFSFTSGAAVVSTGTLVTVKSKDGTSCLNASTSNLKVSGVTCDDQERWMLTGPDADDYFTVKYSSTSQYIGLDSSNNAIIATKSTNSSSQYLNWKIIGTGDTGNFYLQNEKGNYYLKIDSSSKQAKVDYLSMLPTDNSYKFSIQ
jgi:hypothetical protein